MARQGQYRLPRCASITQVDTQMAPLGTDSHCELGGKQHVCTLSTWSGFIWHTDALGALIWQIGNLVIQKFKGARASLEAELISLAEMNLSGQNRSTTVVDMMSYITFWRKQRTVIHLCIDSLHGWLFSQFLQGHEMSCFVQLTVQNIISVGNHTS